MRNRVFIPLIAVCGTAWAAMGCGSSPSAASADDGGDVANVLEVFSWWTQPGEIDAFLELVSAYKGKYPGERVSQDSSGSSVDWQMLLGAKIDASPWDVVQVAAAGYPQLMAGHPGSLQPLDYVYEEPALKAGVIPEILTAASFGGHALGVVTGVHRNNAFLYNMQIFTDQKLSPPTTIAEFLAVCEKLKAAGITPVTTTFDAWILRFMLTDILSGTIGALEYDKFIKGVTPATDVALKDGITSAVDTFSKVITDYVDVTATKAPTYDWTSATEDLHSGKAAMFFLGDWVKGYLVHLGWIPGLDFGVIGPPGASDLFVYGADTFALPTSVPHLENAKRFLSVVASKEAQVAFNKQKGSTPMRTDVRDMLDEAGKAGLDNLVNAKVLVPGHDNSKWDDAVIAFMQDGDKSALIQVFLDSRP